MRHAIRNFGVLAIGALVCSCGGGQDTITITGNGIAQIQFVDVTDASLHVQDQYNPNIDQNGVVFGTLSDCFSVSPQSTGLLITPSTTQAFNAVSLPPLTDGLSYLVTVMPGIVNDQLEFQPFYQDFTPASGMAALRLINASTQNNQTTVDTYVTAPGGPLTAPTDTATQFPHGSGYHNIAPGTYEVRITATGYTSPIIADLPSLTLNAGDMITVIVADPPANSIVERMFAVSAPNCTAATKNMIPR